MIFVVNTATENYRTKTNWKKFKKLICGKSYKYAIKCVNEMS